MTEGIPWSPDRTSALTVYASIGISDDGLSQDGWSNLCGRFAAVDTYASRVHGRWYSLPDAPWQNACVCFEIHPAFAPALKLQLALLAAHFGQDSIAWAPAATEFIAAAA